MELKKSEYRALGNNGTENPVKPEAGDREKQNPAGPRARPECGIGSVAPVFFGSAQPTEESSSAPGRVNPTGQTRTSTFRKLRRLQNVNTSTIGSGPTGNPERSPLSVLNSPEPASGLAFGKAASRPVGLIPTFQLPATK